MRNDLLLCHLVSFEVFFLFFSFRFLINKNIPTCFFAQGILELVVLWANGKNLIANQHKIFIFVWSLEALPLRRGWILRTKNHHAPVVELPMHHHFLAFFGVHSYETPRFPIFSAHLISIHSNGAGRHIPVIQNIGGQTWHFLRQQTVPGNSASLWPFFGMVSKNVSDRFKGSVKWPALGLGLKRSRIESPGR